MSTQITQIRFRQGTAAEWLEANPILADGEPGYETDTNKFKIGDGENTWSVLHYQGEGDGQGITGININGTPAAVVNGVVGLTIPTQTSELTNNSGFVTATNVDNNHYTKAEIDAQELVLSDGISANADNITSLLQTAVCNVDLSIDSSTYVLTLQLKDSSGNNIGNAKTIDLPLESVVVNGRYDDSTHKLILTLQNENTIEIPLSDLISGLQATLTAGTNIDITNNVISSTGADPVLTGTSDPTTSTVGKVNQLYRNTTNNSLFICTEVIETPGDPSLEEPSTYTYTWSAITSDTTPKYQHNIIFQGKRVDNGVEVGIAAFSLTLINEYNNPINTLGLLTSALQAIGANSFNTALQASGLSQYKASTYDSLHYINGIYSTYGTSLYGRALKYDNTNQTYSLILTQGNSPTLDSYTSNLLITDNVIAL